MKKWQNTFRVGIRKCTMTYSKETGISSEWDPSTPNNMSKQDLEQYRNGRNALLAKVAKELGVVGNVLVIET
jgi:hypothetical protein